MDAELHRSIHVVSILENYPYKLVIEHDILRIFRTVAHTEGGM
jgi:hypothetical protein